MIVKRRDLHILGNLCAHGGEFGSRFVNDGDGVGVRLPRDVEEHCRVAVGSNDGVVGRDAFADRSDIGNRDRRIIHGGDDDSA